MRPNYCSNCTKSFASAGKKELYLRTRGTPISLPLYKNKGERNDCNNYRGISLRSIVGKVFARVILIRLQKLAERIYPESQCGFRAERSTIDMIVSLRQLQEKCREQHMPLYIAFIDLTKAFDLVSRDGLFRGSPKDRLPTQTAEHDRVFPY